MKTIIFLMCTTFASCAEFVSIDIDTAVKGSTTKVSSGFDVTAAGKDIWAERDSFRFVFQPCSGDFDVRARVVSIEHLFEWTKAGLMVRQSTESSSASFLFAISAGHDREIGIDFRAERGADTKRLAACDNSGGWLRLTRNGPVINTYVSTDNGETFKHVSATTMNLTDPVLVGMAVTSHVEKKLCKTEFRNVSLTHDAGILRASSKIGVAINTAMTTPDSEDTALTGRRDTTLARAWCTNGRQLFEKKKYEDAKYMYFKALVCDEGHADALLDLGRIYELSGQNSIAAEFFFRAAYEFARQEKTDPSVPAKRAEAVRRAEKLDTQSTRLNAIINDYVKELNTIAKKYPGALTSEAVAERMIIVQRSSDR